MADHTDEVDDYMSDAFLQQLAAKSKGKGAKPKKSLTKRTPAPSSYQQPKKRHILEQEQRDKGLKTELGASNKGYRMLKAMGYQGGALGKSKDGIVEPILVDVKAGRLHELIVSSFRESCD